jgi:hypothetical protein
MDSSVLWSAIFAVWEGMEARVSGLATRLMSTLSRVPNGLGVGVPVCSSGGKNVVCSPYP